MNQNLVEEHRKDAAYLSEEIRKMDELLFSQDPNHKEKVDLKERNNLVALLRDTKKKIPPLFGVGDQIIIKFKRPIKGKVVKIEDPEEHHYLIKPNDTVHTNEMILSESLIELDKGMNKVE